MSVVYTKSSSDTDYFGGHNQSSTVIGTAVLVYSNISNIFVATMWYGARFVQRNCTLKPTRSSARDMGTTFLKPQIIGSTSSKNSSWVYVSDRYPCTDGNITYGKLLDNSHFKWNPFQNQVSNTWEQSLRSNVPSNLFVSSSIRGSPQFLQIYLGRESRTSARFS